LIEDGDSARCPVCRARFRDSTVCSRCGADLEPLMLLLGRTYELRKQAAQCLLAGEYARAQKLASDAQAGRFTRRGADLERLSAWLLRESGRHVAASKTDQSEQVASALSSTDFDRRSLTVADQNQDCQSALVGTQSLGRPTHNPIPPDDSKPALRRKYEGQALIWCSILAGIVSMSWATVKAVQWLKG
jgi:hypothetical protein